MDQQCQPQDLHDFVCIGVWFRGSFRINSIGFTKIPAADGISNRMVDTSEDDLLTRGWVYHKEHEQKQYLDIKLVFSFTTSCTDDDGALQIGESA